MPDSDTIAYQIVPLINTPAQFSEVDGYFSYVMAVFSSVNLNYYDWAIALLLYVKVIA